MRAELKNQTIRSEGVRRKRSVMDRLGQLLTGQPGAERALRDLDNLGLKELCAAARLLNTLTPDEELRLAVSRLESHLHSVAAWKRSRNG